MVALKSVVAFIAVSFIYPVVASPQHRPEGNQGGPPAAQDGPPASQGGPPPAFMESPSCGGDQAVCCTGSYTLEGELVDNCITYVEGHSACSTQSNVYCCFTCAEALGSCVGCNHYY